jgi:hypothetical protein
MPVSHEEVERIAGIIRGAFRPLYCAVEAKPYGEKIGFQLKDDSGNPVHTELPIPIAALMKLDFLTEFLNAIRAQLEAQGHKLDPWVKP